MHQYDITIRPYRVTRLDVTSENSDLGGFTTPEIAHRTMREEDAGVYRLEDYSDSSEKPVSVTYWKVARTKTGLLSVLVSLTEEEARQEVQKRRGTSQV